MPVGVCEFDSHLPHQDRSQNALGPVFSARLVGAPPGYVGYDEGGQLTDPVQQARLIASRRAMLDECKGKVVEVLKQTVRPEFLNRLAKAILDGSVHRDSTILIDAVAGEIVLRNR